MFVDDEASMERRERAAITLQRAAVELFSALKAAEDAHVHEPAAVVNNILEGSLYELHEVT